MSTSQTDLKEQIKSELRQELAPRGGTVVQIINVVLLIAVAFFSGFLGSRYEGTLRRVDTRTPAQSAEQPTEAMQLPPDHPPLRDVGGGDPMAAIMALRERLEQDPNDVQALVGLGNMNFDIQRFDEAIDYYKRAIAIDPSNADVLTDMGVAYRNLGQFDDAIEAFEMANAVDPNHWQSMLNMGIVLLVDKGDQERALRVLEEYLALGPNVPNRQEVQQEVERLREATGGEARRHGPEEPAPEPAAAPS